MGSLTPSTLIAVVRIRGTVGVRDDVENTLQLLNLRKPFCATLVPATRQYLGMLQKAKDKITWGPVSKDIVSLILRKRGRVPSQKDLSETYLKEALGFQSFDDLASMLHQCKTSLNRLGMRPFFTLHPPRKGFRRSTKKPYSAGGELGYRGEGINELLRKML